MRGEYAFSQCSTGLSTYGICEDAQNVERGCDEFSQNNHVSIGKVYELAKKSTTLCQLFFICGTFLVYIVSVFNYIYKVEKNIKIIPQNTGFGTECAI